jgi:type IV secretory pathway ATPase VirB11/archaellum biosynthesis ATPase
MTRSTLLTEKSDRGVYPILNDVIFKIFFGSIENYESLVFLLSSLSQYLVVKEVNKDQLKSSIEVIADIHNSLAAIRGNEVHDPFSVLRSIFLDINCILSNGDNVIFEMQSSQMSGDNKDNNFAVWKKRVVLYFS